jgi:hypothetical protein
MTLAEELVTRTKTKSVEKSSQYVEGVFEKTQRNSRVEASSSQHHMDSRSEIIGQSTENAR